jgi:type IV pilus assembly protein PilZ
MSIERRQHPRAAVEVAIDFESEHNFFAGVTCDISEGGLFVSTDQPLSVGDALDVNLMLPGNLQVQARGVVRWNLRREGEEIGYGVQFTEIHDESLAAIRQFIAAREPMLYEAA